MRKCNTGCCVPGAAQACTANSVADSIEDSGAGRELAEGALAEVEHEAVPVGAYPTQYRTFRSSAVASYAARQTQIQATELKYKKPQLWRLPGAVHGLHSKLLLSQSRASDPSQARHPGPSGARYPGPSGA
eukprot:656571-Rhodomonas_salina.1